MAKGTAVVRHHALVPYELQVLHQAITGSQAHCMFGPGVFGMGDEGLAAFCSTQAQFGLASIKGSIGSERTWLMTLTVYELLVSF